MEQQHFLLWASIWLGLGVVLGLLGLIVGLWVCLKLWDNSVR